ncbi:MAG: hypothetical protein BGO01_03700 [Armatimonadetes bacterium 55-13]|nr:phage portal protein [Armatimonadota bacterium]OJU63052.1 MAG: hypothetical protein BGO01_03700 [Armatimonadetes bacterium 55-13]
MRILGLEIGRKAKHTPPTTDKKGFTVIGDSWARNSATTPNAVGQQPWNNGVMAALVRWTSRNICEATLNVGKKNGDGVFEYIDNHAAAQLIETPNPYYGSRLLWSGVLLSLIVDGNAYLYKSRDGNGKVRELWYLPHHQVTPTYRAGSQQFIDGYRYTGGAVPKEFAVADIVHIKDSIDPSNPRVGLSPARAVMRELLTDTEAARYSQLMLARTGQTVAISVKDADAIVDPDSADVLKQKFKDSTTEEGRGEPIVMSLPVDITAIGINPKDMLLGEMVSIVEQRICAVVGVSPLVLGLASGNKVSTFANYEQAREAAVENYLLPMMSMIADALNRQLLPDIDKSGVRFRWDTTDMRALQEDEDALHTRVQSDYQSGLITLGEGRGELGYRVGPEHDVFIHEAYAAAPLPPGREGASEGAKSHWRRREAIKAKRLRGELDGATE